MRSLVAKRPPSSCTIGRSSGGITGIDLEDHPLGLVVGGEERVDDLQPLDRALLLLALRRPDDLPQGLRLGVEIEVLEEVADRLRAHAALEVHAEPVRRAEAVLQLPEQHLVVDDQLGLELAEELPGLLEAGDRVDRRVAGVAAPGLDVLVHLANLERPLGEGVEVLLARALAQAEVVGQLLDRSRVRARLGPVEHVAKEPVAEVARLVEVLRVDAGDELGVLTVDLLAGEQGVAHLVHVLGDRALLGAGRLVGLLGERRERLENLDRRVADGLGVTRREAPVVPDGRAADELADLLRVLRRDRLRDADEDGARERAGLLERGQALLLGPGGEAAGPELVVLVEVPLLALREVLAPAGEAVLERGQGLVTVDVDALVLAANLVLEVGEVGGPLLRRRRT